jgi:cyclic-di-AMP phosphodiesterase PgpH
MLSIALIVFFLPREGRFKYEFQKGKVWMHEDLFAPFDFPVYKTENEILAEKNRILRDFKPFFRYDSIAYITASESFRVDYLQKFNELQLVAKVRQQTIEPVYFNRVEAALKIIYTRGIIDPSDLQQSKALTQGAISILINNLAYETPVSEIYTPTTAKDYLQSVIARATELDGSKEATMLRDFSFTKHLIANLSYDASSSEKVKSTMLSNLSLTKGLVQTGERIISTGEVVGNDSFKVLESLKLEYENRLGFAQNIWMLLLGQVLLVSILFLVLYLFLENFRKEVLTYDLKVVFILLLISSITIASSFVLKSQSVSIYIIPFAIVPIFIRAFYDSRLALFIHLVTIFLVGFFVPNSFEFVFINFIAGIVAILSLTNLYRRGKLFLTVSLVLLSYLVVYLGIVIIQEGTPTAINPITLMWFSINALLLLASYQLIYVFEKIFGFLSDTTLMELSDTNQELLRKLAEVAPGTFQHSLQVANLAEAAIYRIGGNPLLVRTGALYHDIGKMNNPFYFIENQSPEFNPHHNLEFEESAEIIIKHVNDGVALAKKHRLPEQLIDFICMHHGTSKVQYFWKLFKDKFPEMKDDVHRFVYPGPKPNSKETAVLMMADSVEAASRALKRITHEAIESIVENVITYQQMEEQFNESNITFKDIPIIKQVFKKKLLNIYHARIEYPK